MWSTGVVQTAEAVPYREVNEEPSLLEGAALHWHSFAHHTLLVSGLDQIP